MKRAAIYLRVSTQDQTTANQEHELRQAAERAGWQVVRVYKDHGISGAKGRNGRPAFDTLCRDATKRQFDVVMAWNVDRLGRSLKDLVRSCPSFTRSASTCFCISRVSTRPRRPARRFFRCPASSPSSSARSFKSAFALAYSGPSVKVSDLAGRRSRISWLNGLRRPWRAA